MNKYFGNTIFNLQNCLTCYVRPKGFAKDHYLKKKLSDYYFSRLLPNFYYDTGIRYSYAPHVIKSRILYTTVGFILMSWIMYCKYLKSQRNHTKKYNFNLVTKPYIEYERNALRAEKKNLEKIFF